MYGPTGAGKTYTMLGNEETRERLRAAGGSEEILLDSLEDEHKNSAGVLLYALDYIFKTGTGQKEGISFIKCSYVEIYSDNIYDLFQEKAKLDIPLTVTEVNSKKFVVKGAIEQTVRDMNELLQIIKKGERIL